MKIMYLTMAAAVDDTSHEQEDKDAPGQVTHPPTEPMIINDILLPGEREIDENQLLRQSLDKIVKLRLKDAGIDLARYAYKSLRGKLMHTRLSVQLGLSTSVYVAGDTLKYLASAGRWRDRQ